MTTKVPFSMIDPQRVVISPVAGDNRASIHAAVTKLAALGGGTLVFTPGNYQIVGTDAQIRVPEVQSDLSVAPTAADAQLYFQNLANITFAFDGATLTSTKTNGGALLVLDGCNNIRLESPRLRGATVMSGSDVTTVGTGGIQILGLTAASSNITIVDPDMENLYSGIDCVGDPVNVARVRGVSILGCTRFKSGYYAFAFRNNGDDVVIENAHVGYANRPYFAYGIQNHKVNITADHMNGGFQSLIKAYSRPTNGINLRLLVKNRSHVASVTSNSIFGSANGAIMGTAAEISDGVTLSLGPNAIGAKARIVTIGTGSVDALAGVSLRNTDGAGITTVTMDSIGAIIDVEWIATTVVSVRSTYGGVTLS